jgi:hypothetical protein
MKSSDLRGAVAGTTVQFGEYGIPTLPRTWKQRKWQSRFGFLTPPSRFTAEGMAILQAHEQTLD